MISFGRQLSTLPGGNTLSRRVAAFSAAVLLASAGAMWAAAPASADPPYAGSITIVDSADPVTVGTSYVYHITGTAPIGELYEEPHDPHVAVELFLSGAAVNAYAATSSSGSCSSATACDLGVVPGYSAFWMDVYVTATTAGNVHADPWLFWVNNTSVTFGTAIDTTVTPGAAGADLSATIADSADPVALGDTFTYTATATNNGPTAATGVASTITLSGAARSIVSASSTQGSCTIAAPTVTCNIGNLASAASANVTISVEPQATGTITATAGVSATESDPDTGNNNVVQATTVGNGHGCTITGTAGNDTLNGTNGADVICGLGGDDIITGGNQSDVIYAGTGNDTVDGGNSDDILYGGPGNDIMGGGNGADYLYGEAGNDTNYGETLLGSLLYLFDNGNDHIYGGPGNDDLDGQNGNDTLSDVDGTDKMSGGLGNDSINVQDGAGGDTANGGLGSDTCTADEGDSTSSC